MPGYQKKLTIDLERWAERGWIPEPGLAAIREDLAARSGGIGTSGILMLLAMLLLGFGAMTFVAANWQEMSRLTRLGLLVGGLWFAYGLAFVLFARRLEAFAQAAILLGVALFGACIMLIAQMYHIDGRPPDAMFVWGAGALLAGVLLRSRPALGAAVVLMTGWSIWELAFTLEPHWLFWPVWAAMALCIWRERWQAGYHLLAIAALIWSAGLLPLFDEYQMGVLSTWIGFALAGLATMAAGCALEGRASLLDGFHKSLLGYGFLQFGLGLTLLHLAADSRGDIYTDAFREHWSSWNPVPGLLIAGLFAAIALALSWWSVALRVIRRFDGIAIASITGVVLAAAAAGVHAGWTPSLWISSAAGLGIILWALDFGSWFEARALTILAYIGFAAELLYVYFRTLGALLDTALFYLLAGLLAAAMAGIVLWLERRRARDGRTSP